MFACLVHAYLLSISGQGDMNFKSKLIHTMSLPCHFTIQGGGVMVFGIWDLRG